MRKLFFFFFFIVAAVVFGQNIPKPIGFVNDFADIIPLHAEQAIAHQLTAYERLTSIEIAVVTVSSLEGYAIEDYSMKLAEQWKVGKKAVDNGLIILIAPHERKWRIEVGYGLEPYITDGEAGSIGRSNFPVYFREGNYAGGIAVALDALMNELGTVSWNDREIDRQKQENLKRQADVIAQKEHRKNIRELKAHLLSLMGVVLILIVLGIVFFRIYSVRAEKKKKAEELVRLRRQAKQDVHLFVEYKNKHLAKVQALREEGFAHAGDSAADILARYSLPEPAQKLDAIDQENASAATALSIIDSVSQACKYIDVVTGPLYESEKQKKYTEEVRHMVKNIDNEIDKLFPIARTAYQELKSEHPLSVWLRFEHFESTAKKIFSSALDHSVNASHNAEMTVQKFHNAEREAKLAQSEAEQARALIQGVIKQRDDVVAAKQSFMRRCTDAQSYVAKALRKVQDSDVGSEARNFAQDSKREFEKIVIPKNGLVDWLVMTAFVVSVEDSAKSAIRKAQDDIDAAERRRRRRREEEEERRRSSYSSSSSSFSGSSSYGSSHSSGFGGGGFGGGGASGSW